MRMPKWLQWITGINMVLFFPMFAGLGLAEWISNGYEASLKGAPYIWIGLIFGYVSMGLIVWLSRHEKL